MPVVCGTPGGCEESILWQGSLVRSKGRWVPREQAPLPVGGGGDQELVPPDEARVKVLICWLLVSG